MSDRDSVTKEYMQDSAVFADAFNFLIYGGEQVIKPEQLRPLDTASVALPEVFGPDTDYIRALNEEVQGIYDEYVAQALDALEADHDYLTAGGVFPEQLLRNFIKENEPGAFILITNTSEIIGKGFHVI